MMPYAQFVDQPEFLIEPSHLALILGLVALVWALTVAVLVLACRTHRASCTVHCPILRRDLDVTCDEWDGRMLDVRRCSGLHPPNAFDICEQSCLDVDEPITADPRALLER